MRKIYQKYFEVPEEGKGTMGERVFFARLAVSIACIVLCMSAMGFSAYAFFTASVSSSMNQIQAANYSLSLQSPIDIVNANGSVAADSQHPNKYTLQKGMYDFALVKSGNASTGYCKIKINNNENDVIVTGQISDKLTVRIEVAQETIVEFVACWGTYSSEERFDEENMMIIADKDKNVSVVTKSDTATVSANEPQSTSTPIKKQDSNSTENVTPAEIVNTQGSTTTEAHEKKEEGSSEIEGDIAKNTESAEDVTTSTNTTE